MADRHKSGRVHEPVINDRVGRPGMSKSEKRDRFIDFYMATGDAALSYEQAGYSCTTSKSLSAASNRLLNDPYVRAEITRRTEEQRLDHPMVQHGHADPDHPAIATRDERLRFWTAVMRDLKADMKHRLKSSELLARVHGDFVEQPVMIVTADVKRTVRELLGIHDEPIDITPGREQE